jgi:endonuclease/exonuclease/phosphatase family metal-dependent hydrolase
MPRLSFAVLPLLLALLACREDGVAETTTTSGAGGVGGESGQGGAGTTTSGGGAGTPMKVVNWNVRNFFDTDQDSTDEGELIPTQAEYEEKIEAIATVLRELSGDVVVLQEVENQQILVDLANRVGPEYVGIELVEGNDFRGIDVGAIAKVPFDQVVSHKDDTFSLPGGAPKTFTRDCPEFHLTFGGRRFIFLGVHFRSKGGDDDPERRLAEAFRARQIADEVSAANPEAGVAILGDYNDLPGSDPVELIRNGPRLPRRGRLGARGRPLDLRFPGHAGADRPPDVEPDHGPHARPRQRRHPPRCRPVRRQRPLPGLGDLSGPLRRGDM